MGAFVHKTKYLFWKSAQNSQFLKITYDPFQDKNAPLRRAFFKFIKQPILAKNAKNSFSTVKYKSLDIFSSFNYAAKKNQCTLVANPQSVPLSL
jgi:hypothetical protein